MAATDTRPAPTRALLGRIALAACALPGVMPAQAEEAPEQTVVAAKLAGYEDRQPGLKRLSVTTPSVYLLAPLGRHWAVEGSLTYDDVSGASPRYYTDVSGASVMKDERSAGDVRITRYFDRQTVSLGYAHSTEHDYVSHAYSLTGTQASADQNTTWNAGIGFASDTLNPTNERVTDERRRTVDLQVGVTQAWSATDLVQVGLTLGSGRGYYDDPYKTYDRRPDRRQTRVLLVRWNHAMAGTAGVLRSTYRYYHDSFGVGGHTAELGWARNWTPTLSLTPALRFYTQRAADFYYDPPAVDYPAPPASATHYSTDQRLSAFGALTLGLRADWRVAPQWTVDAKLERYRQSSAWRLLGDGSPGVDALSAWQWQVGVTHRF